MDVDCEESSSRERAASSEPCATTRPFEGDETPSRAKRQRVSSSGSSRSRSVDANTHNNTHPTSPKSQLPLSDSGTKVHTTPHTPTQEIQTPEPTSSKVTLNLKQKAITDAYSSNQNSPESPSTMSASRRSATKPTSEESTSDGTPPKAMVQTPSSSPSTSGSPRVEVININDDDDLEYEGRSPEVAIIGDDDEPIVEADPISRFPFRHREEELAGTVQRIANYFENDPIEDDNVFRKVHEWIEGYLESTASKPSTWLDSYMENKEFWDMLPELIWSLNRRRSHFGTFLRQSAASRRQFSAFFVQFARLAGRFVAIDVKSLSRIDNSGDNNDEPAFATKNYLPCFAYLIRRDDFAQIGINLQRWYNFRWVDDSLAMVHAFMGSGGSMSALTKLARGQLRLIASHPKLFDGVTEISRIAGRIVVDALFILKNQEIGPSLYRDSVGPAYQYFKVIDSGLIHVLEKHVTILGPDAAQVHMACLLSILQLCISYEPFPAQELLDAQPKDHPKALETWPSIVVAYGWKFGMLKRLIVSSQMQLRVLGVASLCSELLHLYKSRHGKDEPTADEHPLLLHFASLILDMKVIDYVIDVGSHPEIIGESGNIVGFLVATKTYTAHQTDMIWDTVMTSQDPRIVEATLRMLASFITLLNTQDLLYFCQKMGQMPLESFNGPMRDHCDKVVQTLISHATMGAIPECIESPPYDLFIKIIRESSASSIDNPLGLPEIQQFALMKLHELMPYGPSPEARKDIYTSCINDISNRTPTASGSICAVLTLLQQNMATDLHMLTTEYGLTRLIVEELEFTSANEKKASLVTTADSPARQARRDLLYAIIIFEPTTITSELGQRLWDVLVGGEARCRTDRDTAWQMLINAARKAGSQNAFIESCFRAYLPKLENIYYTNGALDFAREAVLDSARRRKMVTPDDTGFPDASVLEEIWRMVLTALPNTIEANAIKVLVELHLDNPMILSIPREAMYELHSALVQRCLGQLSSAAKKLESSSEGDASGDNESMVVVASDEQISNQELVFTRSLLLLREFLRLYQTKPYFQTPKAIPPIAEASTEIQGEHVIVQYQAYDKDGNSPITRLEVGKDNTLASFFSIARNATGFKRFRIFHAGKELLADDNLLLNTVESLQLDRNLVLIRRCNDTGQDGPEALSLESEILARFEQLWSYLGMDDKFSREIYHFLIQFPAYQKLVEAFGTDSVPTMNVFVVGQPYKCLYAVYCLRENLLRCAQTDCLTKDSLARSINLIVSALLSQDLIDSCTSLELQGELAQHLSDGLTQLLKQGYQFLDLTLYLDEKLFDRLFRMLVVATASSANNSATVVASLFETILEASLHSIVFWNAFKSNLDTPDLFRRVLIRETRSELRKTCTKLMAQKSAFIGGVVSSTDLTAYFWTILESLIAEALLPCTRSEEMLSLALHLFRKLAEYRLPDLSLQRYLRDWGRLLVAHRSQEEVGHPENFDVVTRGLANLLYWCVSFAKGSGQPITGGNLANNLFSSHLFPDVSDVDSRQSDSETIPVLNTTTRKLLCDTIILLTKDDVDQFKAILQQLQEVAPYDMNEDWPYIYDELPWNFDRSRAVRSSTGYVGLKNLSNTCYLNSLFTQLFMNVDFRDFMVNAHVADGGSAQKLLAETQKLFSNMQNSLKRFVDPVDFAGAIRTYDDTNIDVNLQMDVDEFYNLLFDRWESQILASPDKRKFRSFYGGQLVQQVKSKECPHISERLEPFSAIQCDIKGKSSLQESLQAYVDGEIMEGDNKYKCSTCDKHVNAVKRACLKDVPDNLIFHLKRFDYNLRTMQRSKINDHFSFPHTIDMRPYKVEYLMETGDDIAEDTFELVGILVHAGTAESGHYYSYIRERPSVTGHWVEFNDDIVSAFDPAFIEGNCFGGPDVRSTDPGGFQFDKTWSAYMLFYQRSSTLQRQQHDLVISTLPTPIHVEIPSQYRDFLAQENEALMRRYCLYDESHAAFVLKMLSNLDILNKGHCSEDHNLEKAALNVALDHFDQVVSRKKDSPDLADYVFLLGTRFDKCAECSRDFLEWAIDHSEGLRLLLFRNPDVTFRCELAEAIIVTLRKVKQDAGYAYGASKESDTGADAPRLFHRMVDLLRMLWDTFHFHSRAWPEYFSLLSNMARLGPSEVAILLDRGFLKNVLDCLRADPGLPTTQQYTRLLTILSKRTVAKQISFVNVIELLETLLSACDLSVTAVIPDGQDREELLDELEDEKLPLNTTEYHLLTQVWNKGTINILVEKLLRQNQNEDATQSIIAMILRGLPDARLGVVNAIKSGIRKGAMNTPARPFLRAALTFCSVTESRQELLSMVVWIRNVTRISDNGEGAEYLAFFKDLYELTQNHVGIAQDEWQQLVTKQASEWSPNLLTNYDAAVRTDTEDYLQQTVLRYGAILDPSLTPTEQEMFQVAFEAARQLGVKCLHFLEAEHVERRQSVVKGTILSILAIIQLCRDYYNDSSDDELDVEFRDKYATILPQLRRLTVEEADDDVSEWDNSDNEFSSSEVMEGLPDAHQVDGMIESHLSI